MAEGKLLPDMESDSVNEPLPSYPVRFDLAQEQAEEDRSFRSIQGPFLYTYIGLGIFCVALGAVFALGYLGGDLAVGVGTAVAGVALAIGMTYGVSWTRGQEVVRLGLTETGLEFLRKSGGQFSVAWDDPSLKLNLDQFTGDPSHVFPKADARRIRPEWIDVWSPPSRIVKLETTLPAGAQSAILREARQRGLLVESSRVAFWWHSAPKSPGWLDYDVETKVGPKRTPNGQVTRIRGSAWKGVPEDR